MKNNWQQLSLLAVAAAAIGLPAQTTVAQESEDELIEEVITTGTSSAKPRSASDSPVPVDVLNADQFNAIGSTADLTDNLRALVPSYTATPATGDGSAFVRPTSLRGMSPDQTLVLVNGKRRHRSALVQFFAPAAGNGSHGVDVGMIPSIALKRVEVLRDGAASQYGSDALAGVINFVMKDAAEGGTLQVQAGEHFDGESSLKFAANIGFGIGETGFINASLEYIDNDALSRGIQRQTDEDRLLGAGVPLSEIGADSPFGDSPFLQTWGRPETSGTRFFLNSGFDISSTSQLYARFSLAETEGRYRFFYRNENHSTLTDPTTDYRANGFTGLPAGYTPYLDGDQDDASFIVGIDGEFDSGLLYDFSYSFGKNELDYFLNNTVNGSLPLIGAVDPTQPADCAGANGCAISQMGFDVGGYAQEEVNLNADFSYAMSDSVNLAFGFEAREETFIAYAGEPRSYEGGGSSGFRGVEPANAGSFARDNVAIYADIEHDISDALLVQYAARYENYSDFGSTLNGKLAARFRISDGFAFRGAISTGFHAPTPGQSNVSTIITTFDGTTGNQVEEGLLPVSNPAAQAAGATALTEEKSLNISAGFTADFGDNWTLTLDAYQIEVDDRIYRTGDITITVPGSAEEQSVSFYTNVLEVEHQGIDLILNGGFDMGASSSLDLTLAYAYNTTDVTGQDLIIVEPDEPPIQPVNDGLVEDIENNYPEHRFVLTGNAFIGDSFNIMARANYYGDHYDERGRIGAAVEPSAKISSTIYVDLEAGYQINDNWRVVLGAVNVFDEYIDEIGPPNSNRLSVGLQYPRRTVANYEGGSWYLRASYIW
jgi:iron complex outermembrane receptor protein